MTRVRLAAQAAWSKAQGLVAVSLCIATGMVLPLTLAAVGFHTA